METAGAVTFDLHDIESVSGSADQAADLDLARISNTVCYGSALNWRHHLDTEKRKKQEIKESYNLTTNQQGAVITDFCSVAEVKQH